MSEVLNNHMAKRRFFIVFCLFIGIAIAYVDRVNVSLLAANDPFLIEMGIKSQPVQIGMMMSIFLIAYGLANVILGPLGDVIGPRKMMTICVAVMLVSVMVSSIATIFMVLLIGRAILGVGEGAYYPQQSLFIRNWIPVKERGLANGLWTVGQGVAPALSMPILAYIISQWGWRANFYCCILLTIIPLALFWFCTTDRPRQDKRMSQAELDYIEAGMEKTDNAVVEQEKLPLLQRWKIMSVNAHYWVLVIWYMCLQFMGWGLATWMPVYLKMAKGFSWAEMGWMASLPFVLSIFARFAGGVLSDKIGHCAPILFAAMLVGTVSLYGSIVIPGKYISAVCLALGYGGVTLGTPAAWTLLQSGLVSSKVLSTAGGAMNGIANGFSALSPIIIGFFISAMGNYNSGIYCLIVSGVIGIATGSILVLKKY
ncbi:MFS transporter [Megasphaera paucivorans]|uniref:Sugar phosphate permease n=1 Tax=Megasphaera paucivorans TaxID=349095 RepID=A0A1H0BDA1_9FIRM|nr:MFS transporter [Megasphaera paucivorans]SDN43598.1 Sugar phosphate permease [Megasphaera paucivorans]